MRENTLDEEWTNLAGFDDKVVVATKNWMNMTATFVGRNVKVALMGLFERINPLKYEGKVLEVYHIKCSIIFYLLQETSKEICSWFLNTMNG